jgi:hypothetical protein
VISTKKPNGEPWYVGDLCEVPNTITDTKTPPVNVDPAGLTVTVVKPDGTELAATVPTKTAAGVYYVRQQLTLPGMWQFIWTAPGGEYIGVGTVEVDVRRPKRA